MTNESGNGTDDFDFERDCDVRVIATWMLRRTTPNFVWTRRRFSTFRYGTCIKEQILNHFTSADFTSKVGLNSCLQDVHWFGENVRSFYPRSYCIGQHEEKMAFIDDFRLTACMGVLKWVSINAGPSSFHILPNDDRGYMKGPMKIVNLALAQCERFIFIQKHHDLDNDMDDPLSPEQWDAMLKWYYLMAEDKVYISRDEIASRKCQQMLVRLKAYCPQIDIDGYCNVWIVKPGAKSRGVGIKLLDKLTDILNLVDSEVTKSTKYIVQKYIERPLLICNTKFDIRQWFLVTDWSPLTIYMYKECYLRFCSQPFSLRIKTDAIHLCNNAIQRKYIRRSEPRSDSLPIELMWSCHEFKSYLRGLDKEYIWDSIIYPAMKRAIKAVMLSAQENVDYKKGSFELFGADFMVTEDFRVWLIEINASPCMAPSTEITARMCTRMLDDVLKVVIDRNENRECRIGLFEMIYKDPVTNFNLNRNLTLNFSVIGKSIFSSQPTTESNMPSKIHVEATTETANTIKSQPRTLVAKQSDIDDADKLSSPAKPGAVKGLDQQKQILCEETSSDEGDYFRVEQLFGEESFSGCSSTSTQAQNRFPTPLSRKRKLIPETTPTEGECRPKTRKTNGTQSNLGYDNNIVWMESDSSHSCDLEKGANNIPDYSSHSVHISPIYTDTYSSADTKMLRYPYRRCHSESPHTKQATSFSKNGEPPKLFQSSYDVYNSDYSTRMCIQEMSLANLFRTPSLEKSKEDFILSPPVLIYNTNQQSSGKRKKHSKPKMKYKDLCIHHRRSNLLVDNVVEEFLSKQSPLNEAVDEPVVVPFLSDETLEPLEGFAPFTNFERPEKEPKTMKIKGYRKYRRSMRPSFPSLKIVNLANDLMKPTYPRDQDKNLGASTDDSSRKTVKVALIHRRPLTTTLVKKESSTFERTEEDSSDSPT